MFVLCLSALSNTVIASNANIHVLGGVSLPNISSQQNLNLGTVIDQFNTTDHSSSSGLWGFGGGYQWDTPIYSKPVIFDIGVAAYYTHNALSGIETPAINLISQADTLNYKSNESSWAWMVEPKLISTTYIWQPYIMAGLGISSNDLSDYNETPSNPNSSATTSNSFANNTMNNFAWELGVGMQRLISTTSNGKSFIVSGEYRYMDWGTMMLGTTTAQTTHQGPNFGHLKTNIFDLKFSLQF
jgi:hypothetical protein